jgi:hypothetical protein
MSDGGEKRLKVGDADEQGANRIAPVRVRSLCEDPARSASLLSGRFEQT